MKKYLFVASAILLLAASCAKQPDPSKNDSSNSNRIEAELGKDFTLKKGEVVYFQNMDASLEMLDFYYHPCPSGTRCIWSGLDVYYKLKAGGKEYIKDKTGTPVGEFPYTVALKDSDYKTFATFVVTAKEQSANNNLPQGEKTGWNTYKSPDKYGFEIKYPNDFGFNTNY